MRFISAALAVTLISSTTMAHAEETTKPKDTKAIVRDVIMWSSAGLAVASFVGAIAYNAHAESTMTDAHNVLMDSCTGSTDPKCQFNVKTSESYLNNYVYEADIARQTTDRFLMVGFGFTGVVAGMLAYRLLSDEKPKTMVTATPTKSGVMVGATYSF